MARLGVRREPTAPSFHVASRRLPPCVGPAEHSPMVVPHLPVIRAAAPPGILNAPLPTPAPGPHSAPRTSPHPPILPRPLSTATPGPGPPVPDQSPTSHFCPGGLGPDPSPQLPRDRAPGPHLRISAPGTRPPPLPTPQLPRDRALCLTRPHRRPPSFHRPSSLEHHKSSRQHHGRGWQERSAPVPSSFVRSRARASQCRVLSSGPLLLG